MSKFSICLSAVAKFNITDIDYIMKFTLGLCPQEKGCHFYRPCELQSRDQVLHHLSAHTSHRTPGSAIENTEHDDCVIQLLYNNITEDACLCNNIHHRFVQRNIRWFKLNTVSFCGKNKPGCCRLFLHSKRFWFTFIQQRCLLF